MIRVTVCREHGLALMAAARGCGCSTEAEQVGFLADCRPPERGSLRALEPLQAENESAARRRRSRRNSG